MHTNEIRDWNRRAVLATVEVVRQVQPADLDRPTPCTGWTLRDLLTHMSVQHRGFAAAADGRGADPDVWAAPAPLDDPVGEYLAAVPVVLDAFAADGVPRRRFALPEISPTITFPGTVAIGFHFIDYVVHGWDVARSLGLDYALDQDLLDAALPVALAVPDGAPRRAPGAAFQPALPAPDGGPLDRILTVLGRSPTWRGQRLRSPGPARSAAPGGRRPRAGRSGGPSPAG